MGIFLILINVIMGVANIMAANSEYNFNLYVGIFNLCAGTFIWGMKVNE